MKQTIRELSDNFKKLANTTHVKLPVLLKIEKKDFKLVIEYVKQIVQLNPLSDAHYMQIKIGTNIVYRGHQEEYVY